MTSPHALRVADLPQNAPTPFELTPDAPARATLAQDLDILGIRKLRFQGEIRAHGTRDWILTGMLGATVVQPCVATLDPVTTRIDTAVTRLFIDGLADPDEEEIEMPEDENADPLGTHIDPGDIMAEALALALPLYPRSAGAPQDTQSFAAPGVTPMTDEEAKPFAGLAGLRDSLKNRD